MEQTRKISMAAMPTQTDSNTITNHMTTKKEEPAWEHKVAMKVSGVSIAVNLLLSLFKLLAGILAHSGAMISDAILCIRCGKYLCGNCWCEFIQ